MPVSRTAFYNGPVLRFDLKMRKGTLKSGMVILLSQTVLSFLLLHLVTNVS